MVLSVVVVILIFHILSFGLDGGDGFDGPYCKYLCIQIDKKQFEKVISTSRFICIKGTHSVRINFEEKKYSRVN